MMMFICLLFFPVHLCALKLRSGLEVTGIGGFEKNGVKGLFRMHVKKDKQGYHTNVTCSLYATTEKVMYITWFQTVENKEFYYPPQKCIRSCSIKYSLRADDDNTKVHCSASLNETDMYRQDLKSTYETLHVRIGMDTTDGDKVKRKFSSSSFDNRSSTAVLSTSTQAPSSDKNSKDQNTSTALIASLTVLTVFILLVVVFLIYYFKFRAKTKTTQPANSQEDTSTEPEITYADLSLPEPVNRPLKRESELYSEIVAPESLESYYANLSTLKPANRSIQTDVSIYSEVIVKK